jgi:hypothetical protein
MGIEKYINACLDRKKRPTSIGGPVELVTVMALAQYADKNKVEAVNMNRKGSCLTDHEMAAFIDLKKKYSGYDRVFHHIADCAQCRRKAFDLSRHTLAGQAYPPADIIDKTFAEARSMTVERKRSSNKRIPLLLAAAAAVVIAFSGILYEVFKPKPGAAYITFFTGNVELIHNGKPAEPSIKLLLNDADLIKTGANSFVLVQVEEMIVVKIAENSTVTMKSILDGKKRELFTDKGEVLSRVVKLPTNTMYKVGTPTIVAAVRGTEFSVRYKPGTTVLSVRRGAVGVSIGKGRKETIVPAGTTATFTDKEKRQMISDSESHELETISKIPVIRGIGTKKEAEINDLLKPILNKEAMPEATLEQMKVKYGHIHTVTLYNGKVIEGVIINRGANYTILTPRGKIIVPERQIRATRARYVQN